MDETKELNLDQKVTVRNLAAWPVTFRRIDGTGDINIPPNATARMTRNEIISQVQNSNKLFAGKDGVGSHATLFVEDAPTRIEVGFDDVDEKRQQNVFSDDKVKSLFAIKTKNSFENKLKTEIVTRAEKRALIDSIKRLKLNDYEKIRTIEQYTGIKMN